MPQMAKISVPGPIGHGSTVTLPDGTKIVGITKMVIEVDPAEITRAHLSMGIQSAEIAAQPFLSEETLREAAELWGFDLVKRVEG